MKNEQMDCPFVHKRVERVRKDKMLISVDKFQTKSGRKKLSAIV